MSLPGVAACRTLLVVSLAFALMSALAAVAMAQQRRDAESQRDAESHEHSRLLDRLSLLQTQRGLWNRAQLSFEERVERLELALLEQVRDAALLDVDSVRVIPIDQQSGFFRTPVRVEIQARAAHLPAWLAWFERLQRTAGDPWPLLLDDCHWQRDSSSVGIRVDCVFRVLMADWQADRQTDWQAGHGGVANPVPSPRSSPLPTPRPASSLPDIDATGGPWPQARLLMSASERDFHESRWRTRRRALSPLEPVDGAASSAAPASAAVSSPPAPEPLTPRPTATPMPVPVDARALLCSERGGVLIQGTRLVDLTEDATACR